MKKFRDTFLRLSIWAILFFILFIAIASLSIAFVLEVSRGHDANLKEFFVSWLISFSTGMLQAVIIFILVDMIVGNREKEEEESRENAFRVEQEYRRIKEQQIATLTELRAAITPESRQLVVDKMKKLNLFVSSNLSNFNLASLSFIGVDLKESDLRHADLISTDFRAANFSYALLQEANLFRANLEGATFVFADCSEIILEEATLIDARFNDANLIHANLRKTRCSRANFQNANLQGADLSGANLAKSNLQNANLKWANLKGARLTGCNIENSNLTDSIFDEFTIMPDGSQWSENSSL